MPGFSPYLGQHVLFVLEDRVPVLAKVVGVDTAEPDRPFVEIMGGRRDGERLKSVGRDTAGRVLGSWAYPAKVGR